MNQNQNNPNNLSLEQQMILDRNNDYQQKLQQLQLQYLQNDANQQNAGAVQQSNINQQIDFANYIDNSNNNQQNNQNSNPFVQQYSNVQNAPQQARGNSGQMSNSQGKQQQQQPQQISQPNSQIQPQRQQNQQSQQDQIVQNPLIIRNSSQQINKREFLFENDTNHANSVTQNQELHHILFQVSPYRLIHEQTQLLQSFLKGRIYSDKNLQSSFKVQNIARVYKIQQEFQITPLSKIDEFIHAINLIQGEPRIICRQQLLQILMLSLDMNRQLLYESFQTNKLLFPIHNLDCVITNKNELFLKFNKLKSFTREEGKQNHSTLFPYGFFTFLNEQQIKLFIIETIDARNNNFLVLKILKDICIIQNHSEKVYQLNPWASAPLLQPADELISLEDFSKNMLGRENVIYGFSVNDTSKELIKKQKILNYFYSGIMYKETINKWDFFAEFNINSKVNDDNFINQNVSFKQRMQKNLKFSKRNIYIDQEENDDDYYDDNQEGDDDEENDNHHYYQQPQNSIQYKRNVKQNTKQDSKFSKLKRNSNSDYEDDNENFQKNPKKPKFPRQTNNQNNSGRGKPRGGGKSRGGGGKGGGNYSNQSR